MAERRFEISRIPGFATIAVATFVMLYLPIAALVTFSFNAGNSIAVWQGFSLHWYTEAWGNQAVKDATVRSLTIAVFAALISTSVATLAALGTTRRARFRGETFIYVAINQPLMVPEIVTAVALMILFGLIKSVTGIHGLGYLILAHSAFCIPFAYLPIRARLEGSAQASGPNPHDLYASPWATFRRVTLPILMPGVIAGAMLAFVVSLDEFVIPELLGGPETLMIGRVVWDEMFTANNWPRASALAVVMIGAIVVPLALYYRHRGHAEAQH